MARHPFVISDESVLNSHEFRVISKGIKLDQFNKNPLVLWMHKRPKRYNEKNDKETEILPIGLAYDLRFKGGQLIADVEFDQDDEFAKKIEQKVESGLIRMASPGLEPITWSDNPKYLLPGQKYATLVESELTEISIVDFGSNPMALKLYDTNKEVIELSAGNISNIIPLAKTKNTQTNMDFIQQVALMLGLELDASPESIASALKKRLELAVNAENLQIQLTKAQNDLKTLSEGEIIVLVDANVDKKFTADKREFYIQLGKDSGKEVLKAVLDQIPEMRKPSGTIKFSKNPGKNEEAPEENEGSDVKTFSDLKKKGMKAVELMRKENPDKYIELFKAEYDYEPEIDND